MDGYVEWGTQSGLYGEVDWKSGNEMLGMVGNGRGGVGDLGKLEEKISLELEEYRLLLAKNVT